MTGELSMAAKKTSAEKAREDAENARVENMLDGAFGTLSGLETNKPAELVNEEKVEQDEKVSESEDNLENSKSKIEEKEITEEEIESSSVEDDNSEQEEVKQDQEPAANTEDDITHETSEIPPINPPLDESPSGPPLKGPPSKPPTGPPTKGPPSKPPSGPPSKGPPSLPPSGPPSKGPPSLPPSGPPAKGPPRKPQSDAPSEPSPEENSTDVLIEQSDGSTEEVIEEEPKEDILDKGKPEQMVEESEENSDENEGEIPLEDDASNFENHTEVTVLQSSESETTQNEPSIEMNVDSESIETEAEIARLSAEVERLRKSMAGAAEVIEELENPPMPPVVMEELVIGAHIVGDMARLARQLDREQLIRASMGAIAMLHPEQLEFIISTKHMALLPRMDERDICAAKLGADPPRGAPDDWRVLEVVLASVSLITGGPAAVIHSHGPFTTAASCEKDLVLVQPIDEIGKKHIGKIIIVDPDDDNPEEFLRQVAEALQQGGMRCVVIRGKGAYAVGADLDQAWANAAMLEHSMKVVLLARQANLKV